MESGYEAASMDAVAARAGVSKATIYVHFEGKRALFEAIIRSHTDRLFSQWQLPEKGTDLRQALIVLARSFTGLILSDEALSMYRAVIAEASRQPEIGETFYVAGPALARRRAREFFEELAQRGLLKLKGEEASVVSELFLAMLGGDCHLRALFGHDHNPARLCQIIETAVDLVISRYS